MDFVLKGMHYSPQNPFIIAEVGVNHGGSVSLAAKQIGLAAEAGAHAVKFQTYKADKIASQQYSKAYWNTSFETTTSQHELFSKYDALAPSDYLHLAEVCRQNSVEFLSTPFDNEAAEFLSFQSVFKIASADLTNVPLRRKIAATGKPVILSTGAATLAEIHAALVDLRNHGAELVTLMHCVLRYPTEPANANLGRIKVLYEEFGHQASIGYSDHVKFEADGLPQLVVAMELGATVIEKHFTHNKGLKGNDHYHAMDATDLRGFVAYIAQRRTLLSGDGSDSLEIQGEARHHARRRIFFNQDVAPGSRIREHMLIPLRGDLGIEVSQWDSILGLEIKRLGKSGEPLTDSHFES